MSDPTARRGDNVMALINAMIQSERGWTKGEIRRFLFRRYRGGVRPQTIDMIIQQLIDNTWIVGKPKSRVSNIYIFFPTRLSIIEYERENKREKKKKKEREKDKS